MKELREYGIDPLIADPTADAAEAKRLYGIDFTDIANIRKMDAVILAVAHTAFESFTTESMGALLDAIFMVRISRHGLCPLFSSAREGARPPAVAGA